MPNGICMVLGMFGGALVGNGSGMLVRMEGVAVTAVMAVLVLKASLLVIAKLALG